VTLNDPGEVNRRRPRTRSPQGESRYVLTEVLLVVLFGLKLQSLFRFSQIR
jgi:hypothetical protein